MIDLGEARKRLRPAGLDEAKRPKILDTLDQAEEALRRIEAGGVNRADLAREWGVSRARVSQLVKLAGMHADVIAWVRTHATELRIGERPLRAVQRLSPCSQLEALRGILHRRPSEEVSHAG